MGRGVGGIRGPGQRSGQKVRVLRVKQVLTFRDGVGLDDTASGVFVRGCVGWAVTCCGWEEKLQLLHKQRTKNTHLLPFIIETPLKLILRREQRYRCSAYLFQSTISSSSSFISTPAGLCKGRAGTDTETYPCSRCKGIGTMCAVPGAICAKLGAEAGGRLFACHAGVRRAQKLPPGGHRLVSHQLHGDDRTRRHKLQQVATVQYSAVAVAGERFSHEGHF